MALHGEAQRRAERSIANPERDDDAVVALDAYGPIWNTVAVKIAHRQRGRVKSETPDRNRRHLPERSIPIAEKDENADVRLRDAQIQLPVAIEISRRDRKSTRLNSSHT